MNTPRLETMIADNPVFQELDAYWQSTEEILAKARKADIAEAPRILALGVAHPIMVQTPSGRDSSPIL